MVKVEQEQEEANVIRAQVLALAIPGALRFTSLFLPERSARENIN